MLCFFILERARCLLFHWENFTNLFVPFSSIMLDLFDYQFLNRCFFCPIAVDCIKIAVQNLFKLADTLPACDVCEAVSIVLCFVKDSYPVSSALLTEFESNDGYQLLLKVLLR